MGALEIIAAAIARGLARGWVEGMASVLASSHQAVDEAPNDVDRARALRFRYSVQRVLRHPGDTGPEYTPQDQP